MVKETWNINDTYVCVKCGRLEFTPFTEHTPRLAGLNLCDGAVVPYEVWLNGKLEGAVTPLIVHVVERLEQREELISKLDKDNEDMEFNKGAVFELAYMSDVLEKQFPDFTYPSKKKVSEVLKDSGLERDEVRFVVPDGKPCAQEGTAFPNPDYYDDTLCIGCSAFFICQHLKLIDFNMRNIG